MRVARMGNLQSLGFARTGRGRSLWLNGVALGVLSLLLVVLIGWACGAYYLHVDDKIKSVGKILIVVLGAVAVGFFEEALFRGLLFGGLRRSMGVWAAAIVSSLLFMAVHFARPNPPISPTYGQWNSGLEMFQHMFYTGHTIGHYFPFMLTLFLMGLVLCLIYVRHGSILMAVGLHTGWVLVIRMSGYLFNRDRDHLPILYGEGEVISETYLTLFVAIGFLAFLLWKKPVEDVDPS
jgi:membrane protease YdiL (CAAX protease family)